MRLPPIHGRPPAATTTASPRSVFVSGEDGYACFRTPALLATASGMLLAFCEGRQHGCGDEGDIDLVLRRSGDGGRSWGPMRVLVQDRHTAKNPVPVLLDDGRVLLVWVWHRRLSSKKQRTTREVFTSVSADDGLSWSEPRRITEQVYRPDWGWYGVGPGHGIVQRHGPARGQVVIAARHGQKGERMVSHLLMADGSGEHWRIGADALIRPTGEAMVAELGDGTLMLNSRSKGGQRVVSLSRDGGLTMQRSWRDPQLIEPVNGCQASLLAIPARGPGQLTQLLFSNPADRQARTNGRLRRSLDEGRSWDAGLLYSDPPPAFSGYSDLTLLANGEVGLLFETGDLHLKHSPQTGEKLVRHDLIAFSRISLNSA
ncbi:MAG: sialidase family protein [Cyanobacteria bacterium J06638_7]